MNNALKTILSFAVIVILVIIALKILNFAIAIVLPFAAIAIIAYIIYMFVTRRV